MCKALAMPVVRIRILIGMTVVRIRILIATTAVRIRILIGTTFVRIRILIGMTVLRIASVDQKLLNSVTRKNSKAEEKIFIFNDFSELLGGRLAFFDKF